MRRFAFLIPLLLPSWMPIAPLSQILSQQLSLVPFVGCPAEGMSGSVSAPSGRPQQLPIAAAAASRLASYSDAEGLHTLAPRNWHCFVTYGSDGAFLIVSPQPVSANTIYSVRRPGGFTQPVVVLSAVNGFTSGRNEVSPVINRVFPKHRAFVIEAAKMFGDPVPRYKGPFPADKLHYLSNEAVEYTTPAHQEGLGTVGFLRPAALPITGVEILVKDNGGCCDLTSLAVRLLPADAALASVIRREIEREASLPNP